MQLLGRCRCFDEVRLGLFTGAVRATHASLHREPVTECVVACELLFDVVSDIGDLRGSIRLQKRGGATQQKTANPAFHSAA
jgi:hypothetical protein